MTSETGRVLVVAGSKREFQRAVDDYNLHELRPIYVWNHDLVRGLRDFRYLYYGTYEALDDIENIRLLILTAQARSPSTVYEFKLE